MNTLTQPGGKNSGHFYLPQSLRKTISRLLESRYALLFSFIVVYTALSFIVRTALLVKSFHQADPTLLSLAGIYLKGLLFDLAAAVFVTVPYSLYLLVLPEKLNGSRANRFVTLFFMVVVLAASVLGFFAEFPFWGEFESRFNFIAVDYLIYTYEVINNIRQSYPLPLLAGGMALLTGAIVFLLYRQRMFYRSFHASTPFTRRLLLTGSVLLMAALGSLLQNSWAESSPNRYQNELSKSGLFSFAAAFRANELNYFDFYRTMDSTQAFATLRQELEEPGVAFTASAPLRRHIVHAGQPVKPNVVLVTIESLSADFMQQFGNTHRLTPVLDSLAQQGVLFTGMYATGTRTVRGIEALTLSVPPTPGNSIVRKPDNTDLFTTGTIFGQAGYTRSFFYGGDGYFDNMDTFFGNNGFNITDRQGKLIPHESMAALHAFIPDQRVSFENAWGICDEDLYDAVIRDADSQHVKGQPFFDFVMTTSNHRPFTYPSGKISIPSGTGRDGAVRYTDFAIGRFLQKAAARPWYRNTVFIFVADHCASSAGKDDIDVGKYHIPCVIVNLRTKPLRIAQECSQIDLFPTLFGLMNWSYETNLYGKDVLAPGYSPRALVGTYQQLGYLSHDSLAVLSPHSQVMEAVWNEAGDVQHRVQPDTGLLTRAIACYQTAYDLYKKGGMKRSCRR